MLLAHRLLALWPDVALPPLVLVLAGAVLAVLLVCIVPALRSPLRRVPGPPLSLFSAAALRWHEFRAGRTRYVHALHQRYGPVVRLAPNEVSFASAAAIKDIYGTAGSGYDKTDFYNLFTVYGRRTMFTTLDKERHARRRRILADRYANTNIMRPASLDGIRAKADIFVQRCRDATDGVLDIYLALHAYAFDCVTHHLFYPYGTDSLRKQDDAEIMHEITFDDSMQNRLIGYYSPVLHAIIRRVLVLFAKPRETPLADRFVLETAARPDVAPFTLLSRMHEKQDRPDAEKGPAPAAAYSFDALDAAAESLDHMGAGIDTTGDVLCFLLWELSQPRSRPAQARLRAELRANAQSPQPLPFDRLPYLDAVVQEGLRCFPAIPMSLPRLVPDRGWAAGKTASQQDHPDGRTVDGIYLPAGTVVSAQAYSAHRIDTAVFPNPDTFQPDRWLVADGDADRKRLFFAFASGGRGCIGKHLATVEMKLLLQGIYSHFSTVPDPSMTPQSMAMSDQLISARPLGQKCLLKFIPLEDG